MKHDGISGFPDREGNMKKILAALFVLLLMAILPGLAACAGEITSVQQLNSPEMRVGVDLGSAAEMTVREVFPKARIEVFNDKPSAYLAVAQGKLDAFVYDYNQMRIAIGNEVRGVHLLDETLGEPVRIAVGISPVTKIPDFENRLNQFIARIRSDGTLDDMFRRWVIEGSESMPEIPLPEKSEICLTVGTSGIVQPYTYYIGTELSGYDIELARRFAAWLGAELRFKVYDYGAIIPACATGDVDCVMANLNITPERAEALAFSDVLYEERLGVMVRGGPAEEKGAGTSLADMDGKRIAVATGTVFDAIVLKALPHAQIVYINTSADMIAALESGRIDAMALDQPAAEQICAEHGGTVILEESLESFEFGFVLPKNDAGAALKQELDAWLTSMKNTGGLERLMKKWTAGTEQEKTLPPYASFPAVKGTLTLATEGDYVPLNYYRGNEVVGAEIDMAAQFCEAAGYGLRVETMIFDGILPAVQAGKADLAAAGVSITPERSESVLFSVPYYSGGTVLVVLKTEKNAAAASDGGDGTFLGGIVSSFHKTFIREGRWKLFAEGVVTTLVITLLSILLGTLLGFGVCLMCRNGNAAANGVTRLCVWLVQGMPMVVLLMVLYYIVFGSVAVSGAAVAVTGFTLTFGASVYGLLRMGIGAVDAGQYEAAYALGYPKRRTFFRIILPQALPHVLPAYRGEIVGLIKATAIVGYIAVQDLSKMGDIVRSRTYEAFFPLIAVTVIYFLLEGLLGFLVSRISASFNPKRRRPGSILKGLKTEDRPD